MCKYAPNVFFRANASFFKCFLVVLQILHSIPERFLEAHLFLLFQPHCLKLIDVTSSILQEKLAHVAVVVVISLVVVSSEVNSLRELGAVVLPVFDPLLELHSVLGYNQCQLCIQLFHCVFILSARISNEFRLHIIIEVEVEVSAE